MATYTPVSASALYGLMSGNDAARRKPDYYGIGATLGGVADAYDAMNRSVIGANQAQTSNAQSMARLDSGYYPAQAAQDVAGFQSKAFDLNQAMASKKAVEDAFKFASMHYTAGTPEHGLAMRDHMSRNGTYDAVSKVGVPLAEKGIASLQASQVGTAFIKRNIEDQLVAKMATDEFKRLLPSIMSTPESSPQERAASAKRIWTEALQRAKDKILDNEVVVTYDPINRLYSAVDGEKRAIPIPDNFLAPAYGAEGNPGPYRFLESQFKAALQADRDRESMGKPKPVKEPKPAKPEKPVPNPAEKQLADLEKLYWTNALKKDSNSEALSKLEKKIEELKKQLGGGVAKSPAAKSVDVNALLDFATTSPNLGLVPDDLQEQTIPPSAVPPTVMKSPLYGPVL